MGERIFSTEPLPISDRGVYARLLAACSANDDCFMIMQYVYLRSANDEQLRSFCPVAQALSTDSVELAFSEVNASLWYKATPQQLLSHMCCIDIRTCIKQDIRYFFSM